MLPAISGSNRTQANAAITSASVAMQAAVAVAVAVAVFAKVVAWYSKQRQKTQSCIFF